VLQKWINFIKIHLGEDWDPENAGTSTTCICSAHFLESDYVEKLHKKLLADGAVPSIFEKENATQVKFVFLFM
jgi:hypothetical protein